jgi:hypothetical protein
MSKRGAKTWLSLAGIVYRYQTRTLRRNYARWYQRSIVAPETHEVLGDEYSFCRDYS